MNRAIEVLVAITLARPCISHDLLPFILETQPQGPKEFGSYREFILGRYHACERGCERTSARLRRIESSRKIKRAAIRG